MAGSRYWYARDGKQFGPCTSKQLRALARQGTLRPQDHVMREGDTKWTQAAKVRGLFTAPREKAVLSGPVFFYLHQGKQCGPVSLKQLQASAAAGKLQPEDLIWQEGTPAWAPARTVAGLFPKVTPPAQGAAATPGDSP